MNRAAKVVAAFFAGFIGGRVNFDLSWKGASLLSSGVRKIAGSEKGVSSIIFDLTSFVLIFHGLTSACDKLLDVAWENYNSQEVSDTALLEKEQGNEVLDPEKVRCIQEKQQEQAKMKKAWGWGLTAGWFMPNYQTMTSLKYLYDNPQLLNEMLKG